MRILISVSNKTGIVDFINEICHFPYFENKIEEIIATQGTARHLKENSVDIGITDISEITGYRQSKELKTIDFKLYEQIFSGSIQMVIVNLYPFNEYPSIQNIDIGGVSLLRASAKNYRNVVVVSSPELYERVTKYLQSYKAGVGHADNDIFSPIFRKELAQKAFDYVSCYDKAISDWLKR